MGTYINRGNKNFKSVLAGEYVDKTELIARINATLGTEMRYSCVTRCRRFGKSMAAKMLCAYYDHSCDSRELFAALSIARDPSFERHINKYPVIFVTVTDFISLCGPDDIVATIDATLIEEVHEAYPEVAPRERDDLMAYLIRVNHATGHEFIFIIDEWDAICRELDSHSDAMNRYVLWLRRLFKHTDSDTVFAGVYMTGILPIKRYNTQSALNNFCEYSMLMPGKLAPYFGFTVDETRRLAEKHGIDFDDLEKWYDGYHIGDTASIFNPYSVMKAVNYGRCGSYWSTTGAYDAVVTYIQMNYEGLKDDVVAMLGGGRCGVRPGKFGNDMSVVKSRDDVLTVLIHLGYLAYDEAKQECYIPNLEVSQEMVNAVDECRWTTVVKTLQSSKQLLAKTLAGDADAVAKAVADAHSEHTSILAYNDENSLACVVTLAYYYARENYVIHRELPTGKGYADLVMLPRTGVAAPAIIIELKRNDTPQAAIAQIRERNYAARACQHAENVMLVAITYDSSTKQHSCVIEAWR